MKLQPLILLLIVLTSSLSLIPQAKAESSLEETVHKILPCVEELRGLEFKYKPPVKLMSREEAASTLNISEWSGWELAQQEYEALYLVPPGISVKKILEDFYGSALLGYYSNEEKKIIVVEGETLDKGVLAHELTHALLDQYYPETFRKSYDLTDRDLALSSLLEGDAELVEELYSKAVEEGVYQDCNFNFSLASSLKYPGVIYIQYFPYFEGYNFVKSLRRVGGWQAVNKAYVNPPESTEQIIHPYKYPWEKPVNVEVRGAGFQGWTKLGEDILGEAAIFIMFWNQGLISFPYSAEGRLTCKSTLSDGWAGDRMVVYKKNGEYGYVWLLLWDSEQDAREFLTGYLEMLTLMGALHLERVWQVSGKDYITLWREGRQVTIVNAPTPKEIDEIMLSAGLPLIKIENFKVREVGGGMEAAFTLQNLTPEDQSFTAIVQVKNEEGRVVSLSQISGFISPSEKLTFKTHPALQGSETYKVELYVWRSFREPIPLHPPARLQVETGGWLVRFDMGWEGFGS